MATFDELLKSVPDRSNVLSDDGSGDQPPAPDAVAPDAKSAAPAAGPASTATPPDATDNTDYANMSAMDVAKGAAQHLPGSAWGAIKNVGSAIAHLPTTAEAIGQMGEGALSKGEGWLGVQQNPEDKAKNEAVLDAVLGNYKERYGGKGWAGFAKNMVNDPASYGMDLASVLPGVGQVGEAAGLGSKVADAANIAAKAVDPVQAALAVAKGAGSVAGKPAGFVARKAAEFTSGVPVKYQKIIQAASRDGDPQAQQVIKDFARNPDKVLEIPDVLMAAQDELADKASQQYMATRGALAKTPLDPQPIHDAINKEWSALGPDALIDHPDAAQALTLMQKNLQNRTDLTPVGLDNLKKGYDAIVSSPSLAKYKGGLNNVTKSVIDTISAADPTYGDMLKQWGNWKGQLADLKTNLMGNRNASSATRIAKTLRGMNTASKQNSLDLLTQTDAGKYIPQMIAGAAVNPILPGWGHSVRDILMFGAAGLGLHPGAAVGAAASSPRLVGAMNAGAGKLQRVGDKVGNVLSKPGVTNVLNNAGRLGFKDGGKIDDVESAANRLITAAEKAKAMHGQNTKPLLNVPDEAIASALSVANEAI